MGAKQNLTVEKNVLKIMIMRKRKKELLSEVGFEPTPTYVDQKSRTHSV